MKVLSAVKHLLLVALLVNGLALAACDSSSGGSSDTVVDNPDGGGTGDTTCQPNCTNRECGEDPVCGESCGICEGTAVCVEGQCVDCVQNCTGLECGDDPVCGQSCGECTGTDTCVEGVCLGVCDNDGCGDRQCGPAPNCDGYFCGDNGGDCLTGECTADGMCECVPSCVGKDCGDDGCGGSCGTCEDGYECTDAGVCREEGCIEGSACFDWYDCANACPSGPSQQQCWIECDNALRPAALEAKNAFVDCQTNECGHCTDNDCLNDCIESLCMDEYQECLLTYACGTGTCADWYSCVSSCPDYDTNPDAYYACQEDCNRNSSRQGMLDVNAIQDCLSAQCPSTLGEDEWVECANDAINDEEKCGVEAEPCFGGGSFEFCDPSTTDCLDCGELMSCLNSCASGDQTCYNACFEAGSQTAYDQMQEMYACFDLYCPSTMTSDEWSECATAAANDADKCQTEATPCLSGGSFEFCDPATETCLDCGGLMDCLNACASGDQTCYNACFEAGSETAYNQMQDMYTCFDQYCDSDTLTEAQWSECATNAANNPDQCQTEATPCLSGGSFEFCDPTSEDCLDCGELMDCLNACASGDQTCYNTCFESGSEEAYNQMQDMYECFDLYCDSDTLTEAEWSQCATDAANDAGQCQEEATPCLSAAKSSAPTLKLQSAPTLPRTNLYRALRATFAPKAMPQVKMQKQLPQAGLR